MSKVEKRMWQIRALARATQRKYGLSLPGSLMIEYAALKRVAE